MARVTPDEVLEIIETSLEYEDILVFIDTASMLVTSYLGSSSLSTATLKEIEKYLAAHVLSLRDPRVKNVTIDILRIDYQGQWGMGLNGTSYGQMCIMLDTTGVLSQIARKGVSKKASFSMAEYNK